MEADPWLSQEATCAIAGVSSRSLLNWRKLADRGEEPYATLLVPFERANAQIQVDFLQRLRKSDDPKVLLHLLQARFPEFRFAQKVAVEKAFPEVMDVIERSLPPAIAARLIARISGDDPTVGLLLPASIAPCEVLSEVPNEY